MSALPRFIAAAGLTNLADGVATVAWAWVATLLTRDALLVALVPIALRLPWVLLALPAGIVTDRVDRRRLILAMDAVRAAAFAATAVALWWATPLPPAGKGLALPGLYAALVACALIVGGAEVFRDNAAQTVLPALVPAGRLEAANGRLWSVELVGNALVGPALGALLVGVAVALPFALNAGAYTAAALALLGIAGSFRPERTPADWQAELREGFRFLLAHPLLRDLAVITGVWNLLHQMAMIALILLVQENIGLSAPAYGLILAAGAAGGIAGGLLGERIVARLGPGRTARWLLATSAPAFAAMALAPGAMTLALVLAVFEFAGLTWNIVSVSWRQRLIPDRILGRVNSLYRLLAWGMMPLGLGLSGLIVAGAEGAVARELALILPFWVAAAGALALTALAWGPLRRGFGD